MVNSHLVKEEYCCPCVGKPGKCLLKLRLGETAALRVSVVILQLISTVWGFSSLVKINEICGKFSEGERHFMDKTTCRPYLGFSNIFLTCVLIY